MEKDEESGSPSWNASFFMQTTEDVARAVAAAAATPRSPLPSVVYSSIDDSGSQIQKLQHQVSRLLKGLSSPRQVQSGSYNPEILTSQKRQWPNFQLQLLVGVKNKPSELQAKLTNVVLVDANKNMIKNVMFIQDWLLEK